MTKITVLLPSEALQAIRYIVKSKDRPVAWAIRQAVRRWLDAEKSRFELDDASGLPDEKVAP